MKRSRIAAVLAVIGAVGYITYAYAAGLFPDFPVVGGASYCAGSTSSATGTIIGLVTGCPNTVPAGPTIVTGNEQIPADTRLGGGATPQTVLLGLASLNALPITVSAANAAAPNRFSATNISGGLILTFGGPNGSNQANISALNVSLPPTPIDGQQFALSANLPIQTLSVAATTPSTQSVSNSPNQLSMNGNNPVNNAQAQGNSDGFRFMWNAFNSTWYRLQ